MFSCRPRVELVAAGSRSPCVCNVRMQVRPQKYRVLQDRACHYRPTSLRSLKSPAKEVREFSYLPRPHVLRVLELLLLVVMPLGQDVEQQEITKNCGLRTGRAGMENGNLGQTQTFRVPVWSLLTVLAESFHSRPRVPEDRIRCCKPLLGPSQSHPTSLTLTLSLSFPRSMVGLG